MKREPLRACREEIVIFNHGPEDLQNYEVLGRSDRSLPIFLDLAGLLAFDKL